MDELWYLEGFETRSQKILRTQVRTLPFLVGRRSGCDLSLESKMVSQQHAEFFEVEGSLWLRDLGSTNGTFVNGERVTAEHRLGDGDILHFADLEFRLVGSGNDDEGMMPVLTKTMSLQDLNLPGGGIGRYRELRLLLQQNAVEVHFQPLVHLADGSLLGYEALGRGALENAPTAPGELFGAAEAIGLAGELSVAFRNKAIEVAAALPNPPRVFLNTHPSELQNQEALLASLEPLLAAPPPFGVVLEIHESAVTDVVSLQGLRRELDRLHVGVAFDDFGTGQARLVELAEASPHFLKFDVRLIRDIHLMPKKQDIVRTLVRLVLDMGIVPIAEGVECEKEAAACRDLGFVYGQGYFIGRPRPADRVDEDTDTHAL